MHCALSHPLPSVLDVHAAAQLAGDAAALEVEDGRGGLDGAVSPGGVQVLLQSAMTGVMPDALLGGMGT